MESGSVGTVPPVPLFGLDRFGLRPWADLLDIAYVLDRTDLYKVLSLSLEALDLSRSFLLADCDNLGVCFSERLVRANPDFDLSSF